MVDVSSETPAPTSDTAKDLRCSSHKLHGRVINDASGVIEVSCDNRLCGKEAGVVVLHRFDLSNAELIETKRYQDPAKLFSNRK